jgi:hypothetical protein
MRQWKCAETKIMSITKAADARRPVNELWWTHGM